MAAETITVDYSAGTDVVYTEVLPLLPGTREFRDLVNGTATAPRRLVFSRLSAANRLTGVDRVRIYISRAIQNANSGRVNIGSCTFEMVIPLEGNDFTETVLADQVSALTDFLAGGTAFANAKALYQGSILTGDFSD